MFHMLETVMSMCFNGYNFGFTEPTCDDDAKCGEKCMHHDQCPPGYKCKTPRNNPYIKICCEGINTQSKHNP